jgi:hypothetical protein
MAPVRFEAEARVGRRGYAMTVAVVLGSAVLVGLLWHSNEVSGAVLAMTAALFAAGALATLAYAPVAKGLLLRKVVATPEGLLVDGALTVPRSAVRRAFVHALPEGEYAVLIERPWPRAHAVFLGKRADADALVSALGQGPTGSVTRFRALPPWARHVRWLALLLTASPWAFVHLVRFLPTWSMVLLVGLYAVIALPLLLPQRVEVGQDGVYLRWLGKRRFVAFARIDRALSTPFGVRLVLHDDREIEILLSQKENASPERDPLLEGIEQGLAAYRAAPRADEEALLARGSRSLEEWTRAMRELGAGSAGGYRAVAIPRERLWELVESPAAEASAREGAALALHASLDDEERARLARIAAVTASPRLRIALAGVAEERDGARVRVALEAAELEEAPPSSGRARVRSAGST